jgi:hypothetical protein
MMQRTRRKINAALKAKIALEALQISRVVIGDSDPSMREIAFTIILASARS